MRSISKAISWRIVGSIDTFALTWLITGNLIAAGSVASLETVSKIALYYLHERAWSNVPLGRKGPDGESHAEALAPGIAPHQDREDAMRAPRTDAGVLLLDPQRPAAAFSAISAANSSLVILSPGASRC
jgi:uncharacterized membrane protein